MGFLFSFNSLLGQCDLTFNPPIGYYVAGETKSVIICYQSYMSGLPEFEKADWDADNNGQPDIVVANAVPGTVSIIALGTGNTINSAYCLQVTFTVGTANVTSITATATGNTSSCSVTETNSYETLPIILESFEVLKQNDLIKVNWVTLSEFNNDFFTIEMSGDSKEFKEIGYVEGKTNSIERVSYSFNYKTEEINKPFVYFRLKQTDLDGNFTYSPIKVLKNVDDKKLRFSVNSVNSEYDNLRFEITSASKTLISVNAYDIKGNLLTNRIIEVSEGLNNCEMKMKNSYSGICILKFSNQDFSEIKKVFVY